MHQRNLGKSRSAALKSGAKIAMKAFPEATRSAVIEFFSLGAVGAACFDGDIFFFRNELKTSFFVC
ncbi:hypothetical protein [Staphylococcus pseudintermedius]|uniref:hypothetical protein n=1 Tax=Staphylococcus pseudintermedius TaxID=283734 RepID=UPI001035A6C2|nr:hypothetical protein [Staphylococcus pseudintermedius]TBO49823.1 hypothetical protein EWV34_11870 [Staphylococcus pseudintermedius]